MHKKVTYSVSSAKAVAEEGSDEHTGEGKGSQQKLPLGGSLDAAVVNNTGDDSSREDAVGECDLNEWLDGRV